MQWVLMLTSTPFLTGFSTLLFGRAKTSEQEVLRQKRQRLRQQSLGEISAQFSEELPPEFVANLATTTRNRVYSQEVTFWAFLSQVFSEDASCARAVAQVQQWFKHQGLPIPSANTASYVEARQNLPDEMLQDIHHEVARQLDAQLGHGDLWRGRRLKAIDATSAQAPDTEANQIEYPQPSSQAPGCGLPVVQLVGLMDLNHGGWLDFAQGDIETGELRGFDQLLPYIVENDVVAADRLYSSYESIARITQRGADFIGRNHQARKVDFRRGKKLGPDERLVTWTKPRQQPKLSRLSDEEWERLPAQMSMRVIRYRGPGRDGKRRTRYVVTTLLDPKKYPAEEVTSIYFHRWEIELRFRDIKTTMGMELLRTQSPAMLRKEIMMHAIAYNLIRLLMLKAARLHDCNHRRLSFKGALQVVEQSAGNFAGTMPRPRVNQREREDLLARIAERVIPDRPGRNEPRKKKRRPKSYGWMQKPRRTHAEHFRSDETPRKILDEPA